jgi:threonylcarbamoyladenosine tRNA methylthiotransferase MtaB
MDLVEQAGITHLHVFPYSEREGTPAAKMPQLPKEIRKDRARRLREFGMEKMTALLDSQIGQIVSVLVENQYEGSSQNYLKVHFAEPQEIGQIIDVKVKGRDDNGLVG